MIINSLVNHVNLTGLSGYSQRLKDRLYRQRIIFIHVPKSGGTSLSHTLRARYALSYFKLSEEAARAAGRDLSLGEWMRLKQRVVAYHAADGVHFVQGHVPVDRNFLDNDAAGYKLITLLRNPVDRVISHYFFDRKLRSMTPDNFLDSPRGYVETHVLGHFFGELDWDAPSNPAAAADRAIATLERFAVVGILSAPEAFYGDLKSEVGLNLKLPKRNVGKERTEDVFSPEIIARIEEMCAEDIRIFEHFSVPRTKMRGVTSTEHEAPRVCVDPAGSLRDESR